MAKDKLVGYQIIDKEDKLPEQFTPIDVCTITLADYWIQHFTDRKDWVLRPIFIGDIDKPRIIDLEDPPEEYANEMV